MSPWSWAAASNACYRLTSAAETGHTICLRRALPVRPTGDHGNDRYPVRSGTGCAARNLLQGDSNQRSSRRRAPPRHPLGMTQPLRVALATGACAMTRRWKRSLLRHSSRLPDAFALAFG